MENLPYLYYISICDKSNILHEKSYSKQKNMNFKNTSLYLLKKITPNFCNSIKNIPYNFFIDSTQFFTIIIITDENYKKTTGFKLLMELKEYWYHRQANPQENKQKNDVDQKLNQLMNFYNSEERDKLQETRRLINETQQTLYENLEKLIQRGEKLESLVDKSQSMVDLSTDIKVKSRDIKYQMWWRNNKNLVTIGGITLYLGMAVATGSLTLGIPLPPIVI